MLNKMLIIIVMMAKLLTRKLESRRLEDKRGRSCSMHVKDKKCKILVS